MHNLTFRLSAVLSAALAVAIVCTGTVFAQNMGNPEDRDMTLLKAAERGSVDEVRRMLDLGASIGASDEDFGGTPLHWSAYKGHPQTVQVLLNRGADINAKNKDGRTALILAAAMNQIPVVTLLLEAGADAGITGNDGRSALDWAARKRRAKVVQILNTPLPQQGAIVTPPSLTMVRVAHPETGPRTKSVAAPDPMATRNRALIHAAQRGDAKGLARLLGQGADPNVTDRRSGRTALVWASSTGRQDAVKALLEKGAHINGEAGGLTPLSAAVSRGDREMVKLLLQEGADANMVGAPRGISPLMTASERGFLEIVRLLIEKGADVNACDSSGRNALMLACRKGNPKVIGTLLDAKADANAQDASGRTVLQWAALSGRKDVKALVLGRLSASAPEAETQQKAGSAGVGPTGSAQTKPLPSPPSEPPASSAERNMSLLDASAKGELKLVQDLIAAGADVRVTDKVGATALIVASAAGHKDVVRFLLEQGSDPNAKTTDRMLLQTALPAGMTSLILAAFNGNLEVVELLMEKGADVNAENDAGITALLAAVESDQREVANALLRKGADVNAKSHAGLTALDLATKIGAMEMGDLLVKHGATASQAVGQDEKKEQSAVAVARVQPETSAVPSEPASGAGPKSQDREKAIRESVATGNIQELAHLLDQGADVNARQSDDATLLMVAAGNGQLGAVTLLLDKGAELNAKDRNGKTALTYSVENGHREVTKFLKTRGAAGSEIPNVASRKSPTDAPAGKHRRGSVGPAPK